MATAFVFSGQGSQYVGMGRGVVDAHSVAHACWEEADDSLGFSLSGLVAQGPEDVLTLTENAQPAILAYSIVLYRVLQAEKPHVVPVAAAGHSLGEYSALVAAESLGFSDALRLVRLRGQAMQQAVPAGVGGMVAVTGLDPEVVRGLCTDGVELAAQNSPKQCVVAGPVASLDAFQQRAAEAGARRCMALKVSAPFHSSALSPAGERLRVALAEVKIRAPRYPVIQNVSASPESDPDQIRENLVKQVSQTVRWTDCVDRMRELGVRDFVELGPGRILSGLIKKCDRKLSTRFCDRSAFLEQF